MSDASAWSDWSAWLVRGAYAAPGVSVLLLFVFAFVLAGVCVWWAQRPKRARVQPQGETPRAVEASRAPAAAPLHERLARTRDALFGKFAAFTGRSVDAALFEELELLLLEADLGVDAADALLAELRTGTPAPDVATLRARLQNAIAEKLRAVEAPPDAPARAHKPHVVLVLGVNGSGKTTTLAKLAARYRAAGERVVLGAADTFRAAAREQLQTWGERTGCEVVTGPEAGDPAAVAYETVQVARARGADVALIDTAGRLQTNAPLLDELKKIARVLGRAAEGAPHETLLVLDANTGQNALSQAREFTGALPVSALVLTKLDGSARGGVLVGLADAFGLPVKYIGVGERAEDLRDFRAEEFAAALGLHAPEA